MDPCSDIVTTIMPLETNIINSIYVDSTNTPELGNESCLRQNSESDNVTGANICSIPLMQSFQSKCDAAIETSAEVQDVLHSTLNETHMALTSVENHQNIDSLNSDPVYIVNSRSVTKAKCQNISNANDQVFATTLLTKDGHVSTTDLISTHVRSSDVLPEKQSSITIQNGLLPVLSSVSQCVHYNGTQSSCEREMIEEHGLKILADVISHRPITTGKETVSKQLMESDVISTNCIDVGGKHLMDDHQIKPPRKRLQFKFSADVIDVWRLLEDDEALLLTGNSLSTEAGIELHLKNVDSRFHLSIEASDLDVGSMKDEMGAWQYALTSLGECPHTCRRDIGDLLELVRSRRTSDIGVQVSPGMMKAKSGAIKRKYSARKGKRQQVEERKDGTEGLASVETRSGSHSNRQHCGGGRNVNEPSKDIGNIKSPSSSPSSSSSSAAAASQAVAVASKHCRLSTDREDSNNTTTSEVIPHEDGNDPLVGSNDCAAGGMVLESGNAKKLGDDPRESPLGGELGSSPSCRTRSGRRVVGVSRRTTASRKYKHNIRSNRTLNKELYELNRRVAASLNYEAADDQSGGDKQTCVICGHVSRQRWLLLVHLRRFHVISPERYYELLRAPPGERAERLDSLRMLQSDVIKRHAPKRAGTLPCAYCGEPVLGIRNMRRHLKLKHGRLDPAEVADKLRYYVAEYGRLIHRNRMLAIRKANLAKTEYPCRYCDAVLSMSCTRSRHELYTCPKNPNRHKRHHCNYCGTAYRSEEALARHRAKHAQHDYKFVCDRCGKEYKTKPMLYEHRMNVHQGRQPRYSCTVCRKSFHYRDKLEKHLVTHSDKRDVMCDVCGKLFKTKADVQKHTKYVHERSYPHHCEKCGHGVAKLSYLKTHKCGRVRRSQLAMGSSSSNNNSSNNNSNNNNKAGRSDLTKRKPGTQSATLQATEYKTVPMSVSDESLLCKNPEVIASLSGGVRQENVVTSAQYCMAGVSCLSYQGEMTQHQQQQDEAAMVVSVDQFVRDQCATDMGFMEPAAPSALSVTQFIGPLPMATAVPVYALSENQSAVQQVDGTLLQQQQQQQPTPHIVNGENVGDYKMTTY